MHLRGSAGERRRRFGEMESSRLSDFSCEKAFLVSCLVNNKPTPGVRRGEAVATPCFLFRFDISITPTSTTWEKKQRLGQGISVGGSSRSSSRPHSMERRSGGRESDKSSPIMTTSGEGEKIISPRPYFVEKADGAEINYWAGACKGRRKGRLASSSSSSS